MNCPLRRCWLFSPGCLLPHVRSNSFTIHVQDRRAPGRTRPIPGRRPDESHTARLDTLRCGYSFLPCKMGLPSSFVPTTSMASPRASGRKSQVSGTVSRLTCWQLLQVRLMVIFLPGLPVVGATSALLAVTVPQNVQRNVNGFLVIISLPGLSVHSPRLAPGPLACLGAQQVRQRAAARSQRGQQRPAQRRPDPPP